MDLNFDEVVSECSSTTTEGYTRGYRALCSTCGTYQTVDINEFRLSFGVGEAEMSYVAKMRAWNCCHEGEEPLDGFPEEPDPFWMEGRE